ncbi:CGNR zinc finger domain-containing protein [Saccharopolyspora spinosporotrichia]
MDTSTNQAKRFCSARCANRVHVAAFRARQRT